MSVFPTRTSPSARRIAGCGARLETDGMLVRPIRGEIYLIEDEDLEALSHEMRSPPSGLISRH